MLWKHHIQHLISSILFKNPFDKLPSLGQSGAVDDLCLFSEYLYRLRSDKLASLFHYLFIQTESSNKSYHSTISLHRDRTSMLGHSSVSKTLKLWNLLPRVILLPYLSYSHSNNVITNFP